MAGLGVEFAAENGTTFAVDLSNNSEHADLKNVTYFEVSDSVTTDYLHNSNTEYSIDAEWDYYGDDENYNYDSDIVVYNDFKLAIFDFEIATLGYVRPALVFLTILANIFVVCFFLNKQRRGRASNLLFLGIAVSDTLTGVSLLPNSFMVYIPNHEMLSRFECDTYMVMKLYLSRLFHTVSIWQTVSLGLQRYLCVCHPFISGRICTFWKTFAGIVAMYCLAALMHIYQLLDEKANAEGYCTWEMDQPCRKACLYKSICIIFMHFLPALLLLGLTIRTLFALNKANRRVSNISATYRTSNRRSKEKIITITSVLIVICFLIPELPHGAYKLYVLLSVFNPTIDRLSVEDHHIFTSVYEILLLVSFHANFWIYCAMMYDFRQSLIQVFTLTPLKQGVTRLRSLSTSSFRINGSFRSSRASSITGRNRVLSRSTSVHSTTSENQHGMQLALTLLSAKDSNPRNSKTVSAKQDDYDDDEVFV